MPAPQLSRATLEKVRAAIVRSERSLQVVAERAKFLADTRSAIEASQSRLYAILATQPVN
ncbi:MAG TPA: hypothetical protein VGF88_23655 [Acidobacteriaceae bacterium]|jgi:hypothetical protein